MLRPKEVNQKNNFLILHSELGTRQSRLLSVSIAIKISSGKGSKLLPFFFAKRPLCAKHYTGFNHPEKKWREQCAELLDI